MPKFAPISMKTVQPRVTMLVSRKVNWARSGAPCITIDLSNQCRALTRNTAPSRCTTPCPLIHRSVAQCLRSDGTSRLISGHRRHPTENSTDVSALHDLADTHNDLIGCTISDWLLCPLITVN